MSYKWELMGAVGSAIATLTSGNKWLLLTADFGQGCVTMAVGGRKLLDEPFAVSAGLSDRQKEAIREQFPELSFSTVEDHLRQHAL